MPGLVIIVQKPKHLFNRNRTILRHMTKAIMHEPFYESQFMELPEFGLHVSNVYFDHQSAQRYISTNEDRSIQCLLNGELYDLTEIKDELHPNEHVIRDPDDPAEWVVHLYEDKGDKFLEYLNGYFNLLLVDTKKSALFVANDRFGLHRFYYSHLPDGGMLFAPEVKCFKLFPGLELNLDLGAVIHSFRYNCILNNSSFYKEVKRLPIATRFTFKNNFWQVNEYWTPEKTLNKTTLNLGAFLEEYTATFESIVEDYYTPEQTALSLTGGLDTRSILSVLDRNGIKVPCYTFGGMFADSFDVILAMKLASKTGNTFSKILLGADFLNNIGHWANKAIYISDGIARLTTCHEYPLNLAARDIGKIRLTGKYGSQIVRGVRLLKDRSPDLGLFAADFRKEYISKADGYRNLGITSLIRQELPQLEGSKHTQEAAALIVRTPYMDNRLVDVILRAPKAKDTSSLQRRIIFRNAPYFDAIPTNRGTFLKDGVGRNIIKLFYSAVNFVDTVYNWEHLPAFALPICELGDILRLSQFFNGKKEWVHYRLWIKKELQQFVKDIILDPKTLQRSFYDTRFIQKMVISHYAGKKNYTSEIDKIISFEIWLRQGEGYT